MSSKLNTVLENEIKRFNNIIAYQDKMELNEVSYRFYNEADDALPDGGEMADQPIDNTDIPMNEPAPETPQEPSMDDPGTDMAPDASMGMDAPVDDPGMDAPPMDDPNAGMDAAAPGEEDVTELDITDLVNNSNELKQTTQTAIGKLDSALPKIDAIMGKVGNLEQSLARMDGLIGQIQQLTKQVELMRPPTEDERRKALAKDSYPFSVTVDQYNNGDAIRTQTDLENKSKMSMMDNLLSDYNEQGVKDSFNIPVNDPLEKM